MATAPTLDAVVTDLGAEYERLGAILDGIDDDRWSTRSAAEGWTLADVVAHLALTEELMIATLGSPSSDWNDRTEAMDDVVADAVTDAALSGPQARDRWRAATTASLAALAAADPDTTVSWAAAPLRPRTLAITRLAEHWAHGLDITEPLGVPLPDTDRLRHIAWLGHATLPYAFGLAGLEPVPVRCELTGPGGDLWSLGPAGAEARITGDAGAFCRVGARRLPPERSGLVISGPGADTALALLRNYAA